MANVSAAIDALTAHDKLGILVELQHRICSIEGKIHAAHEDFERDATELQKQFQQLILTLAWTVFADEVRLLLTEFRDSEQLLAGEIASS